MAYTVELTKIERKERMNAATVRFTCDDKDVAPLDVPIAGDDLDPTRLGILCKRIVAQLETRDVNFKKFTIGPIDIAAVVEEVATPSVKE